MHFRRFLIALEIPADTAAWFFIVAQASPSAVLCLRENARHRASRLQRLDTHHSANSRNPATRPARSKD